jgi:hypothetical protein
VEEVLAVDFPEVAVVLLVAAVPEEDGRSLIRVWQDDSGWFWMVLSGWILLDFVGFCWIAKYYAL